jgi:hypothetical protein
MEVHLPDDMADRSVVDYFTRLVSYAISAYIMRLWSHGSGKKPNPAINRRRPAVAKDRFNSQLASGQFLASNLLPMIRLPRRRRSLAVRITSIRRRRLLPLFFALAFFQPCDCLFAQGASLRLSSTVADAGSSVNLSLFLSVSDRTPAGLQWTFAYSPNDVAAISATEGPVAIAAGKTISCSGVPGRYTCLLSSLDTNSMTSGIVAYVNVTLAFRPPNRRTLAPNVRPTSIAISNSLGVDPGGELLPVDPAAGGIIAVPTISSLTCVKSVLSPGAVADCAISIGAAATASGVEVSLLSNNPMLNIPSSITIAPGSTSSAFRAVARTIGDNQLATLTASTQGVSRSVTFNLVAAVSGSATFLTADATTQGSWKGVYGAEGYAVIGDVISYPPWVAVAPTANSSYNWATSTSDVRALQKTTSATDRIASSWWSSDALTVDFTFEDQSPHRVALYFLDWDYRSRAARADVLDDKGNILDTRTISNSTSGLYLVWNLSGHVIIRIAALNGDAVLGGIFFGGAGPVNTGAASFVRADTTTLGSWRGIYGNDGYNVVNDSSSDPPYVAPFASGNMPYTWALSSTDVRALQKASAPDDRIASCWLSNSVFTVNLNFNDGNTHQVALYFVDWDNFGRTEQIDIVDGSGTVLDSRTLSDFAAGQYLVWNLSGHLAVRITTGIANAVLSGIFFATPGQASSGAAERLHRDRARMPVPYQGSVSPK